MGIPAVQAEVAAFLAGLAGEAPVETHISAVFLGADTAWKLKKAVRLGFLDFTAVDDRRRFLLRELALNAPFVPGLYRDVVAVTRVGTGLALTQGAAEGAPEGAAEGPVVDWVLRMARVPRGDFLDERAAAGGLEEGGLLPAMADAVAAMHAAQPCTPVADPAGRLRKVVRGNATAARAAGLDAAAVALWERDILAALDRDAGRLAARGTLVRRAHGDLHLGNMVLWQGRPAPCDALEFDEALATIDPGYDLAFLLMDLDVTVSRAAANRVLCRYVARTGDAGLVGVLGPSLSLRAMIRAHVEATRGRDAGRLLRAAALYLQPNEAKRGGVLAVGGLMGTGKSTLAQAVAPGFGCAPGALVLRSDEVRKRLLGVAPEDRLPDAAYGAAVNRRTAAALVSAMQDAVAGGHTVILDATFLGGELRDRVAAAVVAAGVPFLGVWLEAALVELERRVAARRNDASDATVAILRRAAGAGAPTGWVRVDATDAGAAQREVQRRLAML